MRLKPGATWWVKLSTVVYLSKSLYVFLTSCVSISLNVFAGLNIFIVIASFSILYFAMYTVAKKWLLVDVHAGYSMYIWEALEKNQKTQLRTNKLMRQHVHQLVDKYITSVRIERKVADVYKEEFSLDLAAQQVEDELLYLAFPRVEDQTRAQ